MGGDPRAAVGDPQHVWQASRGLHPKVGLLLLEAKTGSYRYDRETSTWRNASHVTDNPDEQARKQIHDVERFLGELIAV